MNNDPLLTVKKTRTVFWIWAACDITVFLIIFFLHKTGRNLTIAPQPLWITGVVLLILTAAVSIGAPIIIRSLYVSRTLKTRRFDVNHFISTQALLITLPMAGVLLAGIAYFFLVPKIHLYATMIAALYGVYSAVPSKKKLQGEINYFTKQCR